MSIARMWETGWKASNHNQTSTSGEVWLDKIICMQSTQPQPHKIFFRFQQWTHFPRVLLDIGLRTIPSSKTFDFCRSFYFPPKKFSAPFIFLLLLFILLVHLVYLVYLVRLLNLVKQMILLTFIIFLSSCCLQDSVF